MPVKLTVLMDNNTYIDQYFLGEPAVSYYIEDGDVRLLFDAGYSDAFVRNAQAMGIDLTALTHIVLSHGHNDHTRGLQYLPPCSAQLIAHPHCFLPKFFDNEAIGAPFSAEEASNRWNYNPCKGVLPITGNLLFLGEIPRVTAFEGQNPIGFYQEAGCLHPDFLLDDTALVYRTERGIFIITGCSHSGICNIVTYAKTVCGDDRLLGVLGGFHLLEDNLQLDKTVETLKSHAPEMLYPCHCVCLAGKGKMMRAMPVTEVGVGMTFEL